LHARGSSTLSCMTPFLPERKTRLSSRASLRSRRDAVLPKTRVPASLIGPYPSLLSRASDYADIPQRLEYHEADPEDEGRLVGHFAHSF
jgi:hypothetical protein